MSAFPLDPALFEDPLKSRSAGTDEDSDSFSDLSDPTDLYQESEAEQSATYEDDENDSESDQLDAAKRNAMREAKGKGRAVEEEVCICIAVFCIS